MSPSRSACPTLQLLHITDNQLQDWAEVRKLGATFPCLSSLVLANNPLRCVDEHGEAFPHLRSINLNNSGTPPLLLRPPLLLLLLQPLLLLLLPPLPLPL